MTLYSLYGQCLVLTVVRGGDLIKQGTADIRKENKYTELLVENLRTASDVTVGR